MFKTILLPIDLNHDASWKKAVPVARDLARHGGGKLHLLAISPDYGLSSVAAYFPEGFELQALRRTENDLKAFAAEHLPELAAGQVHVAHGHIAKVILDTAHSLGADLIVMASHQPDDLRDFLIGSKADRVVHGSPTSVLVVRG